MATTEKYLKESKELLKLYELDDESKLEFLNTQIEGFNKQAYRFETEIAIAKRYIAVGESRGEDQYVETGQNKITEAVGHLRSIVLNIEVLSRLRDEIRKNSSNPAK